MSLLVLLLVQAAAPAAVPGPPQPASPRTLTGKFTCAADVFEVQVTAAPLAGTGVVLDRLTTDGKAVDAGALAEVRRMTARMSDVQSLDVRCRGDGGGELTIYGTQAVAGTPPRRARLRGTLRNGRVEGLSVGVEQQR